MCLYWTSLSHFKKGTLSSSLDLQAGSLSSRNCHAGIFYKFLCVYTLGKTFSSILRSSLMSSEVTTHTWIQPENSLQSPRGRIFKMTL